MKRIFVGILMITALILIMWPVFASPAKTGSQLLTDFWPAYVGGVSCGLLALVTQGKRA